MNCELSWISCPIGPDLTSLDLWLSERKSLRLSSSQQRQGWDVCLDANGNISWCNQQLVTMRESHSQVPSYVAQISERAWHNGSFVENHGFCFLLGWSVQNTATNLSVFWNTAKQHLKCRLKMFGKWLKCSEHHPDSYQPILGRIGKLIHPNSNISTCAWFKELVHEI